MTCIFLCAFFLLFAGMVLGDVLFHNPPPYLYDPDATTLSYSDWLSSQPALRWVWAGRPAWDSPVWLRVLWLAAAAGLLLWKRPTQRLAEWLRSQRHAPPSRLPLWLLLILAAAFLWIFRSTDLRYGDSEFLTDLVPRETASVGANIDYQEILDCTLHCRLYAHLHRLFSLDIVTVFNLIGVSATLIGLAIVWPRWRRRAGLPAGLVLLLWFTTGWSQLVFGHVEYYTSVAVVLLIYATLAMEHLERDDGPPFWVCSFVAGLAACFHMLAGWIWPTLAVLFWHGIRRRDRSPSRLLATGVPAFLLPIAASVGIATLYGFPPARFSTTHLAHLKFIFLLTPDSAAAHNAIYQYPFLSFSHMRDILNELVRAAWPGIVLVLGLLSAGRRARLFRQPTVQFWLVAAVSLQVFIMVWNTDLGFIRDWDLFAVVALGWTGLGIEWLRLLSRGGGEQVAGDLAGGGEDVVPRQEEETPQRPLADDWFWLLARVLLFVLVTALPYRLLLLLHHSWWVGPVNSAGMF